MTLAVVKVSYAWLYVVIYCICTEKESEPHSESRSSVLLHGVSNYFKTQEDGFMWLYNRNHGSTY